MTNIVYNEHHTISSVLHIRVQTKCGFTGAAINDGNEAIRDYNPVFTRVLCVLAHNFLLNNLHVETYIWKPSLVSNYMT